jgi:Na+/H+ antiporter NhaD/arsenite permease-like protein
VVAIGGAASSRLTRRVKPEKVFIGSLASLIVAEAARAARIEIGFAEYSRVGVPLTVATLPIGWLVLVVVPV